MKVLYFIGGLGIYAWMGFLISKWIPNPDAEIYKLIVFATIGVALVALRDFCKWKLEHD